LKRDFLLIDMKKEKKLMSVAGLLLLLAVVVSFTQGSDTKGEKTKVSESQSFVDPEKQEVRSKRSSEPKPIVLTYKVEKISIGEQKIEEKSSQ